MFDPSLQLSLVVSYIDTANQHYKFLFCLTNKCKCSFGLFLQILISKMPLWTRQLSRCCSLLNTYNIIKSAELRKQSVKMWTCFLEPSKLHCFCPYGYYCHMLLKNFRTLYLENHRQFCSSSTEPHQTSLSLIDKPKPEILPTLNTEELLQGK